MVNLKLMREHTQELNVLYVEDDMSLLETTSELLGNFFKKLSSANNGESGLTKYIDYEKEHGKYYDLIITDINMPKMNGIIMSEKILAINPEQSIIITTAHNEIEFLSAALDLGVDGFITKPIKNEKLMHILYKVAHAISNDKFVESHIGIIEDLNLQLEEQNRELTAKNSELEKSFRMLDTMVHKEQITVISKKENTKVDTNLQEQIQNLIADDLFELQEIQMEIDIIVIDILNSTEQIDKISLQKLTHKFTKYASILSFYHFFDNLGTSMKSFAITINDNPLPENEETFKNIFMLVESFMYVLEKWQNELSKGDAQNINSLDASMISDMKTIVNMWTELEEEYSEEDLDGIFDF